MENRSSLCDQFLKKIHQNIEDNLGDENFSVSNLAENVGLSRSMLHRKLIKLTGKSASDLIKETRLIRAKELLENDVATVSEIAYQVGFRSPSYFNKVFKKCYKVSPGDVRKGIAVHAEEQLVDTEQNKIYYLGFKFLKSRKFGLVLILTLTLVVVGLYVLEAIHANETSIAVLPLHNLTGQAENDYFVDGMHDALIGELGQFASLRVISRTSTLRYREHNMLLKDIAEELGVNCIVEGSVFGVDDSIRILIQLMEVFPKERHMLANEYRDGISNVLAVQSSAVKDIAQKINIELSAKEEQRLTNSRTVNPETYKAYLRGMHYLNQGTKESFEKGINYLQQAIDRDPGDPFAYAGLAVGYALVGHGQLDSNDAFLRAMSAANKAIKLDPTIDEAYSALSILYLYQVWDWYKAKNAFENAIANNPNSAIAHAHFAWYYILFDDFKKSIYHAKKAVMLEPFSASYTAWLALLYYHNKEYDKAEIWARKALDLKDDVPYGNLTLGWVFLQKKMYQQAIEYHEKLPVNGAYWKSLRAYAYVKAGQREKALAIWNEFEEFSKKKEVNACYRGMIAASLGFTDKAFELLNDACNNKTYPIIYINFYPCTEDIRNDDRYNKLLQKMNLPWEEVLITSNQ
ncbi:helix-turn-helix domain-containing protein [Ancylomarina sp. YFZ004]